jgi:hypothetical protein
MWNGERLRFVGIVVFISHDLVAARRIASCGRGISLAIVSAAENR